jgi:hypothetical protein
MVKRHETYRMSERTPVLPIIMRRQGGFIGLEGY